MASKLAIIAACALSVVSASPFSGNKKPPGFCKNDNENAPGLPEDLQLPEQIPDAPLFRKIAGPISFFCAEDLFDCELLAEQDSCTAAFFKECSECFLIGNRLVDRSCACDCLETVQNECERVETRRALKKNGPPEHAAAGGNSNDAPPGIRPQLQNLLEAAEVLEEFAQCVEEQAKNITGRCKAAISQIRSELNRDDEETDSETIDAASQELCQSLQGMLPSSASMTIPATTSVAFPLLFGVILFQLTFGKHQSSVC